MPADRYVSPVGPSRHEVKIRRSRFIACLFPVTDDEQARARLGELRHEFHDARHHCSAQLLGPGRDSAHSSDDGEPAGTAGVPIMQALTSHVTATGRADLSNVLAVVVRYFGGVELGAGGLARAYGGPSHRPCAWSRCCSTSAAPSSTPTCPRPTRAASRRSCAPAVSTSWAPAGTIRPARSCASPAPRTPPTVPSERSPHSLRGRPAPSPSGRAGCRVRCHRPERAGPACAPTPCPGPRRGEAWSPRYGSSPAPRAARRPGSLPASRITPLIRLLGQRPPRTCRTGTRRQGASNAPRMHRRTRSEALVFH